MTRAEIEKAYRVVNGRIASPGKFEGEPIYAPGLWAMMLDGATDATIDTPDGPVDIITIDPELRQQWPELRGTFAVALWEEDTGFVHLEHFETESDLAEYASRLEETEPFDPEPEDITTEDHCRFYQSGKLVVELSPDASTAEMWRALDAHMERTGFYPNVWFISDHGNAHLMTRGDE
jgi:hypothetical protein